MPWTNFPLHYFLLATLALVPLDVFGWGEPFHVVIDAGHGGSDQGIRREGLTEKDLALQIAQQLVQELERRPNLIVVQTRKDDYDLSFDERRRIANAHPRGVYLSIHFAGASDLTLTGSRVFINGAPPPSDSTLLVPLELAHGPAASQSLQFATLLTQSFLEHSEEATTGIAYRSLVPLLGITIPAALVEVGFLTAPDRSRWKNPQTIEKTVKILALAIDRFRSTDNNPPP